MRVLVTGSSGFLGRHIIAALHRAEHRVVGLDLQRTEGVSFADNDITRPLSAVGKLEHLDAVVHLAAVAAPRECEADPGQAFNVNVNGTHQVLKLSLAAGVKKFVFVSSAHVYGISPRYLPTDERHPLWHQDTYTVTKILGEQLCQLYYDNHGLSYTTLRLFNAYGPGQSGGYFIPDMIAKAKNGRIDLAEANTTKDFVYVKDVARAFVAALDTPFVGPINIGTGRECDLHHVAYCIAQEIFGPIPLTFEIFASVPGTEPTRMCSDSGRAKRVLDWESTVTLEEGLDATINGG